MALCTKSLECIEGPQLILATLSLCFTRKMVLLVVCVWYICSLYRYCVLYSDLSYLQVLVCNRLCPIISVLSLCNIVILEMYSRYFDPVKQIIIASQQTSYITRFVLDSD